MSQEARAKILDGATLIYNEALTARISMLLGGPVIGREVLDSLAQKKGYGDAFDWSNVGAIPLAAPGLDSYVAALDIVKIIGTAAGSEMCRLDYDDEWDILFQEFRGGLISTEGVKRQADGTLEDLFHELGKHCSGIVGHVLELDGIAQEELLAILEGIFDAFAEAVVYELT